MDDDRYPADRTGTDTGTDTDTETPVAYRDAAVIGGIHLGGPKAGLAVAAAGYGKAGAAIACGSVAASMAYAVFIDRYRDGEQDEDVREPVQSYTISSDGEADDPVDGNRQVLEALHEFGVLEEELSDVQQEQYRDTIRDIREDDERSANA